MSNTAINSNKYTAKDLFKLLVLPTVVSIIIYISPVDLIPDVVPICGTLDDFAISAVFLNSMYKKTYTEITGKPFDGGSILSKSKQATIILEHIVTSIIQIFADMGVVTTAFTPVLSALDMIVFLGLFYISALADLNYIQKPNIQIPTAQSAKYKQLPQHNQPQLQSKIGSEFGKQSQLQPYTSNNMSNKAQAGDFSSAKF